MTASLLAVAVAVAVALAAPSQSPPGFRDTPIEPRIQRIAAVGGATAHCARDAAAWRRFLRARRIGFAYALTDIRRRTAYVGPVVCSQLEAWLRGRRVPVPTLAHAVFVAGHEAMHLRGIEDESAADCATWRGLRAVAAAFGIRDARLLARIRAVMAPEVPQCR